MNDPFIYSTKMASTHGNHNVYVTDLRTGKNIKTLVGHPRTPWCVAFHPSSNQILASGCLGGQVRIWDLSVSIYGSIHYIIEYILISMYEYRVEVKYGQQKVKL